MNLVILKQTQYVKNKLEYIGLKDIIKNNQIYFDPNNHLFENDIEEDKEMLAVYNEFNKLQHEDVDLEKTAPFIIRFVFDKIVMMENNITMDDVYLAIMKFYNVDKKINYYFSDDNSKELIGRISITSEMDGDLQENGLYDQSDVITVFKNIIPFIR